MIKWNLLCWLITEMALGKCSVYLGSFMMGKKLSTLTERKLWFPQQGVEGNLLTESDFLGSPPYEKSFVSPEGENTQCSKSELEGNSRNQGVFPFFLQRWNKGKSCRGHQAMWWQYWDQKQNLLIFYLLLLSAPNFQTAPHSQTNLKCSVGKWSTINKSCLQQCRWFAGLAFLQKEKTIARHIFHTGEHILINPCNWTLKHPQILYINNSNGHEQIFIHTAICRCKLKPNYLKSNSELYLQGTCFNPACCSQLLTYPEIAFANYSLAKVLLFLFNNSLSNHSFLNVKSWNLTSWLNDRDIFCFFLCPCFLLGHSAPPILNKYVN